MDENKQDSIDQYLRGELQGEALEVFLQKLSSDSAFRQEVALEQVIVRNIKNVGRQEVLAKLERFHEKLDLPQENEVPLLTQGNHSFKSRFLKKSSYAWLAAASIVLVLVAVFAIKFQQPSPAALFTTYYKPYPSLTYTSRASSSALPTPREQAFEAYNRKAYLESVQLFKQVLAQEEDEAVLFYLGNSYLAAGRIDEAKLTFQLYLQRYTEFKAEATWYLGLIYLQAGNMEKTKQMLMATVAGNSEYSEKAKEILNRLE